MAAKTQPTTKAHTVKPARKTNTGTHHFTPAQRVAAVTAMEIAQAGNPTSYAAVAAARKVLNDDGLHHTTLLDWYKMHINEVRATLPTPTMSQVIQDTQDAILNDYMEVRRKALARAKQDEVINEAKFDKLMLGIGITQTKIDEMTGLPSDEVAVVIELKRLLSLRGYDMKSVMEQQISRLKAEASTPHASDEPPAISAAQTGDGAEDKP